MPRWKQSPLVKSENRLGIAMLSPSIVLVGILIVLPIVLNVVLTFHYISAYNPRKFEFVGLQNYLRLLSSEVFWSDFKASLIYMFGSIVLQLSLGLALALFLNQEFAGRNLLRGVVILPYIIPTICATFMARWILDPGYGIMNFFLNSVFGFSVNWLGDPKSAMISAILVNTWRFFPFVEIALLARLQTISPSLYEAAEMDGAGGCKKFLHITLPELTSVIFVVALLRSIWAFNDFTLMYLLTRGGPMNSTEILPLLAYREAFENSNIGMGATVSVFMTLFLFVIFGIYYRIFDPLKEA